MGHATGPNERVGHVRGAAAETLGVDVSAVGSRSLTLTFDDTDLELPHAEADPSGPHRVLIDGIMVDAGSERDETPGR